MIAFIRKDDANDANRDVKAISIEEIILGSIRENPKITQKEIATKAGVSRATIQRAMKTLTDKRCIIRVGATRGQWQIRK